MHVWALGLQCETRAAPEPPGFHTTEKEGQKTETPIWAKVGQLRLAKVGQIRMAKVGLAKVGISRRFMEGFM